MATKHRKNASEVATLRLPQLPHDAPQWARDLLRALQMRDDILLGVQLGTTDLPLRAKLAFVGFTSVLDDGVNDRIVVTK